MEAAPAETLAPSSPDMGRFGVTVGLGLDVTPEFGVDASYSYVAFLGRESTSEDAPLARYSDDLHVVALTLRLAVGAAGAEVTPTEPDGTAAPPAPAEGEADADGAVDDGAQGDDAAGAAPVRDRSGG